MNYTWPIYRSERQEKYSEPMIWIGLYIACASLVCILAMVADLLHGIRRGKLWFPCKYFRINSAFLAVISVAMKLPVDLSGSMPGDVDQVAKLGSMAFMCTMMANLLPCLSTMDNNALWSNITALCLLVITMVVNVCIQIQTGVVSYKQMAPVMNVLGPLDEVKINKDRNIILASIYVASLLWLLMVHVCSCLAILKSKKIIESKYQQGHDGALKDIKQSSGELITVEQLQKYVKNHWIMAGSGSPQFITACFRTTSASGVICVFVTILHTFTMFWSIEAILKKDCGSDYGLSMIAIVIAQFIGVVIGTIAPISRCFAALSFKVSLKIISNHFKVFKLESYWTSKLYDWKRASLKLPLRSHSLNVVMETSKKLILSFCIEFQEGFVVVCKILALIPYVFMICVLYSVRCLKWLLHKYRFNTSLDRFSSLEEKTDFFERNEDLRPYVLQLEDEMELAERTLEGLSKSVNQLIQNGENSQANINLMNLIEQNSTGGFHGVAKFDNIDEYHIHHVPFLQLKVEYQDCWSLPVVTLTTIAISLPTIEKKEVDYLLESVREGLLYVTLVEENLNATDDYVSIQEAAKTLWKEVDIDHEWLGHKLQDISSQVKTTKQIVECFRDTAKNIVYSEDTSKNDDSIGRSMCGNSMYRITKTILNTYRANIDDEVSQRELFDNLSSMITDIMAACLINLPQVIAMKCHTSAIEIREASVKDAARLLGETTQIIKTLQRRGIPDMNPSDLPFMHKWRAHLGNA
ncbi:hypothetical protein HanPI659440_Chr10g0398251 [Helianthus annuus]|nr:hypothetical protein HanPI659440_Chr10g0398251 [Helianthus annuus]